MNVKPGDLAIVINAPNTPELVGRIVKVERRYTSMEPMKGGHAAFVPDSVVAWVCSAPGGLPNRNVRTWVAFTCPERAIADSILRPVSGLPDEQHTEEDNKLEA